MRVTVARGILTVTVAGQVILTGCARGHDSLNERVTQMESSAATLQARLNLAEASIDRLDKRVLDLNMDAHKSAIFDPGDPGGFQRVDTEYGSLLVSFQNATPYLDGFRVTCHFGNPYSMRFNGVQLKAKWGRRPPLKTGTPKDMNDWEASLHEKALSLTNAVQGGSWNPVSFILAPARADEFGYLELSMETNSVGLAR